jgi:TolB-like protein/Tfp pilus assembly protein PilF
MCPHDLEKIVGKALRKNRDERYQNIKDLQIDLKDLRQDLEFQIKLKRTASPSSRQTFDKTVEPQPTLILETGKTFEPAAATVSTKNVVARPSSSAEYILTEIKQHKRSVFAGLLILFLAMTAYLGYRFYANRSASNDAKQISSIAVLPFVNESGNADAEYLSDGMTETLISSLSQLPNLNVKARSSVFRYKGKDTSAPIIGKELNVQAILTGRVVQRGRDLILYIELVDAQTENSLWKQTYNKTMTNLVALQTDIARDVANRLKIKLSGADEANLAKNYTQNPEAYQLYLKGRYHFLKITRPETQKAVSYFQQAIEVDSSYALAYAGLADAYRGLAIAGEMPPTEFLPKAKAAAQKAIEIDDTLADAYAVLAFITFWHDWNWNEAENQFKRALELDPNNADAHIFYANLLSHIGRHAEALAEAKRARELDPLNLRINALEAQFLLHAGQTDEALTRLQKTLELDPNFWLGRLFIISAYIEKGMYGEAAAAARRARDVYDSTRAISFLGFALAKSGKHGKREPNLMDY